MIKYVKQIVLFWGVFIFIPVLIFNLIKKYVIY